MITAHKIDAVHMANAIRNDMQFRVPVYPRFLREVAMLPLSGQKFLFEGTEERQVLGGKSTGTLLPVLLPLLDGTRTLDDLQHALPACSKEVLYQTVVFLYARGLLEDAAADHAIDTSRYDKETLNYFRRHVDTTRVNRSGAEAIYRLSQAKLEIFAPSPWGSLLEQELRQIGLTDVRVRLPGEAFPLEGEASLMVVFNDGSFQPEQLRELDQFCAEHRIRWLLSEVSGEKGELFYFERGETPCYCCVEKAHPRMHRTIRQESDMTEFWVCVTLQEIIYCLSRINPLFSGQYVYELDFGNWETRRLRLPFVPGCRCRPIDRFICEEVPLAVVYEHSVAFPSHNLTTPKSHQIHYRASNTELIRSFKRVTNFPTIDLPPYRELPRPEKRTLPSLANGQTSLTLSPPVTLPQLALLALYGAGIKSLENGQVNRWSATGGNLGSVELYLIVRRVEGIGAGVYFYEPQKHSLAWIEALSGEQAEALIREAVETAMGNAPAALLVAASNVGKVSVKYNSFSYRIACLDAGVALAQMSVTANGLDLPNEVITRWDDYVLADCLRLMPKSETVSGALAIY